MKVRLVLAAVCLSGGITAQAAVAQSNLAVAKRGASWLASQGTGTPGQQADTIVALASVGTARTTLRARLRNLAGQAPTYGRTAGGAGKVVLAAVASGSDPRNLNGVNYVARIKATYRDGRYGSGTYDQAYAMLALRAAGETVPVLAMRRVMSARGTGGWGYRLSRAVADDVSATGLMIQALRANGLTPRHQGLAAATTWLAGRRNSAGGFAIAGGRRPTEANSTAIAIMALRSMGRRPAVTTIRELRRLQQADGAFRFTRAAAGSRVMATVDAVPALSGRILPVR